MSLQRVRLNKNKDYVYCFLKEEIIEEEKLLFKTIQALC